MTQLSNNSESCEAANMTLEERGKITFTKIRIIKNLVIISVGTLLVLGSDDVIITLQSTINREHGIGIASMAVQYASSFISSLLLPKYLVLKYGSKAVMVLSIIAFIPFFVANYYPVHYLMIPSSVINGMGFPLLWGAIDPYINELSSQYFVHQMAEVLEIKPRKPKETTTSIERYKSLSPDLKTSDCSDPVENAQIKVVCEWNVSNNGSKRSASSNRNGYDDSAVAHPSEKERKADILESTTARFFGFHSMIYQTCYIFSNILSYYVLHSGYTRQAALVNSTCNCGARYCNIETDCSEHNLQQPSTEARNILISICVGLGIISVIVVLFLDGLDAKVKNVSLSLNMLLATFRQTTKKNHLLLVPLTIYIGMLKGFYVGDFTKSFIGCAWGIQYVGLVTACSGVTMAISSIVSGWFVKYLGRLPIFTTAAILNVVFNIMLLLWRPDPNQSVVFFVAASLWGSLFGTFYTQVRAFYGILFKEDEEAAFGTYQLWYCFGACLCFSYSDYICNDMKIYLLISFSTLGIIGYLIAETSHSSPNKQKSSHISAKKDTNTNNKCPEGEENMDRRKRLNSLNG